MVEQRFVCNGGGSDSGLKKLSTAKKIESPSNSVCREGEWAQGIAQGSSEKLSEKLAKGILARLKKTKFSARLVALELSYRYPQHHIPQLIPLTERDEVENMTLAGEIDSKRWIRAFRGGLRPRILRTSMSASRTRGTTRRSP